MSVIPMPGRSLNSDQRAGMPNEEIVTILKNLLAQAESGDLQGLVFASTYSDQSSWDGLIAPSKWDQVHLLGSLCTAQFRINTNLHHGS
jgi:hypothetical protein